MTQILRVDFSLKAREMETLPWAPFSFDGKIVRVIVRLMDDDAPVRVMHLDSGNVMCLLPEEGLPCEDMALAPLDLPAGPALRLTMRLRSSVDANGYALIVVHAPPEVRLPEYTFSLVPRYP